MGLGGKTAVITGGASGIGLGIAKAILDAGGDVILLGRTAAKLDQAKANLNAENRVRTFPVDVGNRKEVEQVFEDLDQQSTPIDILVNAAGVNIPNRTMAEMRPEQFDDVLQINATGAYNTMYQVLPQMRERHNGLIINICSISGVRALSLGGIAYCASKFAMAAVSTAVGNEEAPNGVRVTTIHPGEVNTPILEKRPTPVPEERKAIMVQPEDIGAMVVTIAQLPGHTHVPELIVKPLYQEFV